MQYGPWSDSSNSDPADSWASPELDPDCIDLAFFAALGPPVLLERFDDFLIVEAVPFFFAAVWAAMLGGCSIEVEGCGGDLEEEF